MNTSITINEERLKNTFIELVGVPCPSCDEKQEAELLVKKLHELGMEPQVDRAGEQCGGTTGNVWGFLKGNVPGALRLFLKHTWTAWRPRQERMSWKKMVCCILTVRPR